ncbi:UPF0149 family protein [Aeromonas hydrophila]|uniref:UPF0149 family protein n=1 Tax=Aeromonas hydrophila TaxID=644 RepID=UPI001117CB51|nr:UPF0149 family protein [Aeromonas hydrophila]EIS3741581.1 UPF0149 family protein [Aeromonas hydrophila]
MQSFEILSDEEFDELEALLERYGSENSIASMSMLDGFLTAVVSGPHLIMPSTWRPAIWGGEQDQPEWQSEAELERFIDLVMRHSNDIATTLTYAAEDYFPVTPEFERHGEWVPLIHDWCGGYLGAIELAPWPTLPAPEAAALAMISEPLEKMPTSLEALSNEHLQEQATKVRFAARILHAYFLAQRSERPERSQPVVAPIKIGRNEPCPCGSGKKYKQCCLH